MAQPQVESGKKGSGQEVQCGSFLPHLNMGTELTWAPIYKGVCVCVRASTCQVAAQGGSLGLEQRPLGEASYPVEECWGGEGN